MEENNINHSETEPRNNHEVIRENNLETDQEIRDRIENQKQTPERQDQENTKNYQEKGYVEKEKTPLAFRISERTLTRKIREELICLGLSWKASPEEIERATKKFRKIIKDSFFSLSGTSFKWELSVVWLEELGFEKIGDIDIVREEPREKPTTEELKEKPSRIGLDPIVSALIDQLTVKDEQIKDLSQRLSESQRLTAMALPAPKYYEKEKET